MTFDTLRENLRKKHVADDIGYCSVCMKRTNDNQYVVKVYPCDVIQLLNAWDAQDEIDGKVKP